MIDTWQPLQDKRTAHDECFGKRDANLRPMRVAAFHELPKAHRRQPCCNRISRRRPELAHGRRARVASSRTDR